MTGEQLVLRLSAHVSPGQDALAGPGREIADIFGIDGLSAIAPLFDDLAVPGRGIVLITGYSGAGKSTLLGRLTRLLPRIRTTDELTPARGTLIDNFAGPVADVIAWLGHFGLSEAKVMISPIETLSVGQQHRLMLARLLWNRPPAVAIDEFLSTLDRTTAQIVAHGFQKVCRRYGITAYVCTAHSDLVDALDPDHVVRLDLAGAHESAARPRRIGPPAIRRAITVETGDLADYRELAPLHYRFGEEPDEHWREILREVRIARYDGKVVAVRLFSQPFSQHWVGVPICAELNSAVLIQERTVVHPAFRGLGLTKDLLPTCVTTQRVLLTHSALARYVPFHRRSGFHQVDHPSAQPLPAQRELVRVLRAADPSVNPNSVDSVRAVVRRMSTVERARLLECARVAFIAMNTRFVRFLAGVAELRVAEHQQAQLRAFLTAVAAAASVDDEELLAGFVESCAPFEVAGYARPLIQPMAQAG